LIAPSNHRAVGSSVPQILPARVDVDEPDVAHLRLGERTYVTARTFGESRFWGRVVQIGEQLDKKILENLVQLDVGHELPVGLWVDAYIETSHIG
jgi:hypothetical protein